MKKLEMKLKAFRFLTIAAFIASGTLVSCVADSNSPGLEYMPDMYRSPSVEGQVDYGEVQGMYSDSARNMVADKFSYLAPVGTIPYTVAGEMYLAPYEHGAPLNVDRTHGLYEVRQDSLGLENSKKDVNPVPYSEDVAKEGKELFGIYCIHCHGEKGDGQGTVITNGNNKYPTPGAYRTDLYSGEIFYTITYGKNAMGSHASQLNPIERWKVVYHVEKLIGRDPGAVAEESSTDEVSADSTATGL